MSWLATTGASLKKEYLTWRTIVPRISHSVNGWAGPSGLAARNGLNSRFTMVVAALTNPVAMTPTNVWMGSWATVGDVSTSLTVLACLVNAAKPSSSPVTGSSAMDINVNGTSDSSPPPAASAVSIRSASDSCADSPESAVDPVTIGVDSSAKESCCAPASSVPTDSPSGSVPAAGAASTSGSVDAGGISSSVACPASLVEVSRPPELSRSICGAVDSPAVVDKSAPASVGAAGAVDGPGGGGSAPAGGAVAVPVVPPAPASGEPSADGALEESVPVSARATLSPCPVVTSTPTPSATASAPTRPM